MRPPSRFAPLAVLTLLALSISGSAAASDAKATDAASVGKMAPVSLDSTFDAANARVDARLSSALSGPTTMDCSHDAMSGYETCVVRASGSSSSAPAALAQN